MDKQQNWYLYNLLDRFQYHQKLLVLVCYLYRYQNWCSPSKKPSYYHILTPLQTNLVPYILTICTLTPNFALIQYTQQKARDVDTTSGSWSWGVLESVKARWNSGVITVTSALVNEHQQWNGLASWTSTQVKRISDYFKSPPTGQ